MRKTITMPQAQLVRLKAAATAYRDTLKKNSPQHTHIKPLSDDIAAMDAAIAAATAPDNIASAVFTELARARGKFKPFNSPHEGYAVILEELDELWHEIKHGEAAKMHAEAIQVAAMALRFLYDTKVAAEPAEEAA